jgi:hypothetical protein
MSMLDEGMSVAKKQRMKASLLPDNIPPELAFPLREDEDSHGEYVCDLQTQPGRLNSKIWS